MKADSSLTHESVWRAIDALAKHFGYSPSGLAKQAGLDPTTFNKSKRINAQGKPRWPSTESIARILDATGADVGFFLSLLSSSGTAAVPSCLLPMADIAASKSVLDDRGFPIAKAKGWDEVRVPQLDMDTDQVCYALESDGRILVVAPGASLRAGDRAFAGMPEGKFIEGTVSSSGPNRFPPKEALWTARVVWVSA